MADAVGEVLRAGFILGDGGAAEEARTRGYGLPRALAEFPGVVRMIHRDYFRAGAQVLRAQTCWTTPTHLKRRCGSDWAPRAAELTRAAVRLARQAIDPDRGPPAWVAGCLAPPDRTPAANGAPAHETAGETRMEWEAQVAAMVAEGVDLLVCDSFERLDDATRALEVCRQTTLPVIITVALDRQTGATADGATAVDAARALAAAGAAAVGVSGTQDAAGLWPAAEAMKAATDVPVALVPFGYRTYRPDWEAHREAMVISGLEMAKFALQAKVQGLRYFAAGDGAGPEIIRKVAQDLGCERYHVELHAR
jgi:methionine synthase I (cobalamin-dependent)